MTLPSSTFVVEALINTIGRWGRRIVVLSAVIRFSARKRTRPVQQRT
jgi:hypothetical protein